jgi:ATP-dependent 26S proteasome regulatory subunit
VLAASTLIFPVTRLPLDPDVSLARVVAAMPRRCSGADVKAAATNAFYAALREAVAHIRAGEAGPSGDGEGRVLAV